MNFYEIQLRFQPTFRRVSTESRIKSDETDLKWRITVMHKKRKNKEEDIAI